VLKYHPRIRNLKGYSCVIKLIILKSVMVICNITIEPGEGVCFKYVNRTGLE
jgi:hypothetical protein